MQKTVALNILQAIDSKFRSAKHGSLNSQEINELKDVCANLIESIKGDAYASHRADRIIYFLEMPPRSDLQACLMEQRCLSEYINNLPEPLDLGQKMCS